MSYSVRQNPLDFVERELLYCWGKPEYRMTIATLHCLATITEDPDIKGKIVALREKVIQMPEEDYRRLYRTIRRNSQTAVKGRIHNAEVLHEYAKEDDCA